MILVHITFIILFQFLWFLSNFSNFGKYILNLLVFL